MSVLAGIRRCAILVVERTPSTSNERYNVIRTCASGRHRLINSVQQRYSTVSQHAQFVVIQETGTVSPERIVPSQIDKPAYATKGLLRLMGMTQRVPLKPDIKNDKQIQGL